MQEVEIRGVAKTKNPTKYSDGDSVRPTMDVHGRQVMTLYHVRDLYLTADASVTTGTNTSLAAADGNHKLDLVEISFANNSASVSVALKNDGTTVRTFQLPASQTVQFHFPGTIPGNAVSAGWSVDMEDVTGTTVSVGALFVKLT